MKDKDGSFDLASRCPDCIGGRWVDGKSILIASSTISFSSLLQNTGVVMSWLVIFHGILDFFARVRGWHPRLVHEMIGSV